MKVLKLSACIILSLSILIFTACSGGGGSSSDGVGLGTVSFGLTDSTTDKYLAVYVTIDEVQVNINDSLSNGNSGWEPVATPKKTYNLLKLVNGVTEILGEDKLEAGTYRQIRLIIGKTAESENNINGVPHPEANYVVLKDGSYVGLKIPSGYKTGVKLVHTFKVEEDSFVELVFDFEACKSVVETGSGRCILKPTIKVIKTADKREVYGTVTDDTALAIPITGAIVSAQISDGLSASVVRSTLTSDGVDVGDEGEYTLLLSPDQTYNIVVYSDEEVGEPGNQKLYSPVCEEITVPLDYHFEHNIGLTKSDFGTINGDVKVNGVINPIVEERPVVYISFFSWIPCGTDEAYIEVTSLSMSPDENGEFSFSVNLPVGTYDVVASSEDFEPYTEKPVKVVSKGSVNIFLEL
jgi:hypothetical protein